MAFIDITAVSRLKHADLYAAAKKMGGQSALARHLGITPSECGDWCNLKATPPKSWTDERRLEIEVKLLALTGKGWDELFPQELIEAEEFLKSPKTFEQTKSVELEALLSYASRQDQRLGWQPPEERIDTELLRELMKKCLKSLSFREKEVLRMRFGLDGNKPLTLEETGKPLGIRKERVRQLESRALQKLKQPSRAGLLMTFAPERVATLPPYKAPREVWPSELYANAEAAP